MLSSKFGVKQHTLWKDTGFISFTCLVKNTVFLQTIPPNVITIIIVTLAPTKNTTNCNVKPHLYLQHSTHHTTASFLPLPPSVASPSTPPTKHKQRLVKPRLFHYTATPNTDSQRLHLLITATHHPWHLPADASPPHDHPAQPPSLLVLDSSLGVTSITSLTPSSATRSSCCSTSSTTASISASFTSTKNTINTPLHHSLHFLHTCFRLNLQLSLN